jgi:hypothetical protein
MSKSPKVSSSNLINETRRPNCNGLATVSVHADCYSLEEGKHYPYNLTMHD